MSFEADYTSALLAYSPLQAVVAGRVGVRLLQEGPFPAIQFQRISTERLYTMSGRNQLCAARVQNNCWAQDGPGALALADLLIRALDTVALTTPNPGSPAVYPNKPTFVINQVFMEEPGPEPVFYRVVVDARVYFLDSA